MADIKLKIENHQKINANYLKQLAHERNTALGGTPDCHVIIDDKNHHYQLTRMGWHNRKYNFSVLMHFSIKEDGKIWIQQNITEVLVGKDLEQKRGRGGNKSDMAVGFRPEYLREGTGYAVA